MHAVCSAAPRYAALARAELEAALPPGCAIADLAPGSFLVSAPGRFADLAPALRDTVFVRHAGPADLAVPVPSAPTDAAGSPPADEGRAGPRWAREVLAPRLGEILGPAGPAAAPRAQVQVQVLPGAPRWSPGRVAAALRPHLAAFGVEAASGPADLALSVAIAPGAAFAGFGPVAANLAPWPGGAARLQARPGEISRSARKLEEALELFSVALPPNPRALDLGAAPGGWTSLLLAKGAHVTAVDPGLLDPALRAAPGLTVLRGSAAAVPVPPGPFDLLAVDMNGDPGAAARAAARFHPALRPGAPGIFTIKFFRGASPTETVRATRARLARAGFTVVAVRHLFHDREEATAFLRA